MSLTLRLNLILFIRNLSIPYLILAWTFLVNDEVIGEVFYGQVPPHWRNCYHSLWFLSSTTCSNATAIVQWAPRSFSRPQLATDNGVRDGKSIWLAVTPKDYRAVPSKRHFHCANESHKSRLLYAGCELGNFWTPGLIIANAPIHRTCNLV